MLFHIKCQKTEITKAKTLNFLAYITILVFVTKLNLKLKTFIEEL